MNELLDNFEENEKKTKLFSNLSCAVALLIVGIFFYINSLISPEAQNVSDLHGLIDYKLAVAARIAIIIGFACTIISIVRKEPSSVSKWFGGIINCLLFALWVGSMLYHKQFILF